MEIDDIFASKGKLEPIPSSSTAPSPVVKKKKKKRQKQKQRQEPTDIVDTKPAKKRPVPETVVDPSTSIPPTKRLKGGADEMVRSFKSTKGTERDDEERFKDSRGSGPRRKTEEGYSIYKEDELGIRGDGGNTPLCPFDCQCCF